VRRREGDDVVLISYGASMAETLKAADALAEQGIAADVIDLRWLMPWDERLVLERVAAVGRVVLVSEAPHSASMISEVAATIAEEVLDMLEAPPLRVSGFDTPYPYAQDRVYLPGSEPHPARRAAGAGLLKVNRRPFDGAPRRRRMPKDVVLPELAESVVEGEVTAWLVEVGAHVAADEPLVEVMTDKVTVELPSPFGGVLVDQVAAVGDVVAVGAVLGRIDEAASDGDAPAAREPPSAERAHPLPSATSRARCRPAPAADDEDRGDERSLFKADTSAAAGRCCRCGRRRRGRRARAAVGASRPRRPAARGPFGRVVAVPAARRLARELGVPIEQVEGSGPSGRVRVADVERHGERGAGAGAAAGGMPPAPRYQTPPGFEERETRTPLRGLRRVIAQQLTASHLHTVRALHVDEADVSALVRLRATLKPRAEARGAKLSYLPFVMKAVVHALQAFPALNTSLDDATGEVVHKATSTSAWRWRPRRAWWCR
jgi:pyruvate/2-oxoglutarate dehydrogenase complex dihydrolipoamide acyltransferase (E2) component